MNKKPNVILITVDVLRADHLGFMGYEKDVSPVIDNLAKESVVFSEAFSVGPNTPHSFPAILTSTHPFDYQGVKRIERPRKLISEVLKEDGFVTAAFHSNPYLSDFFGYNRGWDFFEHFSKPVGSALFPSRNRITRLKTFLTALSKKIFTKITTAFFPQLFFRMMYWKYRLKVSKEEFEIPAEDINRTIKDFVSAQKENPFFIWVHYMDVHSPYFPNGKYEKGKVLNYSEFISAWIAGYLEFSKSRIFKKFITPYLKQAIDFYDKGISYLDKELGNLFVFLKKEGIYQNTIICLTADHGEEFLEHGAGFHKAKLYNELLHIPLLIKIPDKGHQLIEEKVSLISLAPTLCQLVEAESPSSFKGKSLFDKGNEFIERAFSRRGINFIKT